jgi:flagellar hook-associated protein 1 FlgK
LENAELSRDAMHGVSLDEEMVNLMEGQRMYEAAARVITAVDEALDVLINRTGIVGR